MSIKLKEKNTVVGLGEIGRPILKLLSSGHIAVGYDQNAKLMDEKPYKKYEKNPTSFLHICIPFDGNFIKNINSLYKKFRPKCIIIHSTVSPETTKKLQKKLDVPIIYSATRGVHARMLDDLKRYVKFFALEADAPKKKWAATTYKKLMNQCGIKTKQMSSPVTLELAKIVCDTSYYGWLISYAQLSNTIAIKHGVNYDEMWSFSDEIHKFLGNRPKMHPGFIGGHCVIPNLSLIRDQTLALIASMNMTYAKKQARTRKKAVKHKK